MLTWYAAHRLVNCESIAGVVTASQLGCLPVFTPILHCSECPAFESLKKNGSVRGKLIPEQRNGLRTGSLISNRCNQRFERLVEEETKPGLTYLPEKLGLFSIAANNKNLL